jgi:DNA primase
VGIAGLAVYGSGVHLPQYELLARYNPQVVLLGFDMDDAGERATRSAMHDLKGRYNMARVPWLDNDPAATPLDERLESLLMAVSASGYGNNRFSKADWAHRVTTMKQTYEQSLEER